MVEVVPKKICAGFILKDMADALEFRVPGKAFQNFADILPDKRNPADDSPNEIT